MELKPCPFCGGEAALRGPEGGRYFVACASVDCFVCVGEGYDRDAMPDHLFSDEEQAVAAWNRRAQSDAAAVTEKP